MIVHGGPWEDLSGSQPFLIRKTQWHSNVNKVNSNSRDTSVIFSIVQFQKKKFEKIIYESNS